MGPEGRSTINEVNAIKRVSVAAALAIQMLFFTSCTRPVRTSVNQKDQEKTILVTATPFQPIPPTQTPEPKETPFFETDPQNFGGPIFPFLGKNEFFDLGNSAKLSGLNAGPTGKKEDALNNALETVLHPAIVSIFGECRGDEKGVSLMTILAIAKDDGGLATFIVDKEMLEYFKQQGVLLDVEEPPEAQTEENVSKGLLEGIITRKTRVCYVLERSQQEVVDGMIDQDGNIVKIDGKNDPEKGIIGVPAGTSALIVRIKDVMLIEISPGGLDDILKKALGIYSP